MGERALVVEADGARNVVPVGAREDAVAPAYRLQEFGDGGSPFGCGPGGLPERRELGEVLAFPVVVEAGDDVEQRVRIVLVFGKILPQIGLVDVIPASKEEKISDKAEVALLDPERGECPPVEHERLLVEHQAVQGPFPVRGEDHIDGVRIHRAPHMVDLHKPLAETAQQVNHGADPLLNDAYRRPFPWGWPRRTLAQPVRLALFCGPVSLAQATTEGMALVKDIQAEANALADSALLTMYSSFMPVVDVIAILPYWATGI